MMSATECTAATETKAICVKCRHYQPAPIERACGRDAFFEWVKAFIAWRSCKKGAQTGMNYVAGKEIWSYSCETLNAAGDCAGFEEGEHAPRQVLVSASCWCKPWTWGDLRWEYAVEPREEK